MDLKPSYRRDVFLNFQSSVISGSWLFLFFFFPFFFVLVLSFSFFFPFFFSSFFFPFIPTPFLPSVCVRYSGFLLPGSQIRAGHTSLPLTLRSPREAQSQGRNKKKRARKTILGEKINEEGSTQSFGMMMMGLEEQQDPFLLLLGDVWGGIWGQGEHKGSAGTPILTPVLSSGSRRSRPVTALGFFGGISSLDLVFLFFFKFSSSPHF